MSAAASGATATGAFSRFRGCLVPLDMDALLSGKYAAMLAGVSLQVIVNWRKRGYLPFTETSAGKRYKVRDVLAAEALAAQRCESMAGRPVTRSPSGIAA